MVKAIGQSLRRKEFVKRIICIRSEPQIIPNEIERESLIFVKRRICGMNTTHPTRPTKITSPETNSSNVAK